MPQRSIAAARRRQKEEIVDATRMLFDERGLQDAPIKEIARAVGINKALIYRHFASKEELFVLTVTRYLDQLAVRLRAADEGDDPVERLRACTGTYADYCLEHPAFLDCSLSLMRRPADELRERVSEGVWFRLGRGMADCLAICSSVLADGARRGALAVEDPDFEANRLYTQTLGTMHLARIGVGVRGAAEGIPGVFAVEPGRVRDAAVAAAVASVLPRVPAQEPTVA